MKEGEGWSIGELAERAGVTVRTIRYYVGEGLLPPPGGSGPNRVYGREHRVRLQLIRRLQQEHLPLHEIRARLARLSLAEMESLLERAPPVPRRVDPRQLLAAVLAPPAVRDAAKEAEQPTLLRDMVRDAGAAPYLPLESLWRRVPLAPGAELHYQIRGDPEWEAAVLRVAGEAAARLAGLPRPDHGPRGEPDPEEER